MSRDADIIVTPTLHNEAATRTQDREDSITPMASTKRKVLITGAAGKIGTFYRKHLGDRYDLRLVDLRPVVDPDGYETLQLDLADPVAAQQACAGMETVLHLAANPSTRAEFYRDLLDANFKATYNVFRAAKDQGCQRVIFASSINAVGGYPHDRTIYPEDAPCPANVYGVSKAFGESLGSYFAHVEGLSTICVRIGAVGRPEHIRPERKGHWMTIFVSHADLCQLFDRCIETPDIRFAIVHGVSNNRHLWLDLEATRRLLGYDPQDDAFRAVED